MIYFLNLGTIPEEANYKVVNERGAFVGDLSEKFVERLAVRDVFVLGGKSYEYVRTKGMRIFTKSASGRKPTVPSWTGEMLPRSFDLSMEIAHFRRELAAKLDEPEESVTAWLEKDFDIDNGSARSILSYFKEQMAAVDLIPNDRTLAMEGYIDRTGNHNIIFHFPFGRRVNDALSRAYAFQVTAAYGCNVSVSVVDDAFMLSIPCKIKLGDVQALLKAEQLDVILRKAVKDSEIFKQRFRHTAARSFMILRNYKGREVSVGRQQVRSGYLLDYLINLENFPVIKETYREILEDVMDIGHAKAVLSSIESGEVAMASIDFSATPSPFAHNVVLAGISDIVLMEDRSSLLKQLHRKVLSKVMEGELDRFEFEQEAVDSYFRRKRGRAESKEDVVELLRRTGPLHIFKERGRSIYPYSAQEKTVVDNWSSELLEEGRIASVYADDANFVAADDLPVYGTILKRERALGEADRKVLAALDRPRTANELSETLQIDADKIVRSLHVLEATQVIGRSSRKGGKWRYARRDLQLIDREKALDKAIARFVAAFGPAAVEEIAFAIGQEEENVRKAVSALVAEEVLDEGRFLVSEHPQFMLKLDHLRLRSAGREVFDNRSVETYRRSKINGPFASIEDGLRYFGEAGQQLDLFRRVQQFDMDRWGRMRTDGTVLLGRFYRGRVRYILAEDAPMYVAAYRNAGLTSLDQRILDVLGAHGGLSMRGLVSLLGLDKEEVKESLDRLDRNAYVVRRYEEGEDWARENVYLPYEVAKYQDDAQLAIVKRFVNAYGPIPFYAITTYTGFQPNQVRSALAKLNVEVITVGDIGQEMYLMPEELPKLSAFKPEEEGVKVVSLYDPEVQPMWAEIASRFGDSWVFPIIANGRLVGALEKWNMSGCVDVRSLDLDDPSMLPGALQALDEVMEYSKLTGLDIVRLREVLGKPTEEVEPDVVKVLEASGYFRIGNYFAKGRLIPRVMTKAEVLAYVFQKQRVGGRRKFDNILIAVKRLGSLRSDGEAFIRTRVKVSLKKLLEQGMLVRATSIPEFSTYTTPQQASLCRAAKGVELDQDMRSLLEMLAKEGAVSRRRLFDLSPVGEKRTHEAMRKLYLGSCIYLDGANRFRAVPKLEMEQGEARKAVVRNLFENFGLMSAENLSRFMKFELRMRELRDILAKLEDDAVLVKGFLVEGDDAVHWMLAADAEKKIALPKGEFVLTPMDNLSYLLYPLIRERFGSWQYVVFQGAEMLGAFKGRKKGKDLYVYEIVGGKEVKRIMAEGIRQLNMTIREGPIGGTQEWELQEFYEKTHPGET
jgi:ATP-dependent Lhr-like helicase